MVTITPIPCSSSFDPDHEIKKRKIPIVDLQKNMNLNVRRSSKIRRTCSQSTPNSSYKPWGLNDRADEMQMDSYHWDDPFKSKTFLSTNDDSSMTTTSDDDRKIEKKVTTSFSSKKEAVTSGKNKAGNQPGDSVVKTPRKKIQPFQVTELHRLKSYLEKVRIEQVNFHIAKLNKWILEEYHNNT